MTAIESPAVHVVKGDPDPDELAALVASLLAAAASPAAPEPVAADATQRAAGWQDAARSMRAAAALPRPWRWSTRY